MKKIILYSLTAFVAILMLASCRKSDNPRIPDLARVPQPQLTKDASADAIIAFQNPDAFSGKFTVGLYAPNDVPPAKMDIVVRKNGNNSNIKVFQANVTSFPSTLSITGVQLKGLFGAIALGDSFDIGANVTTQEGKEYPAFSTSIVSGTTTVTRATIGTGVTSQANAIPVINYSAVCKFTMTDYGAIGSTVNMLVVTDDWGDYTPGKSVIPVKIIDATHMSFMYAANNAKPITITINPNTNVTSVAAVTFGDYGAPYGDWIATSVANNPANIVTPCELGVSVILSLKSTNNYTGGDNVFKFRKQ